jgi:hypothetical protein
MLVLRNVGIWQVITIYAVASWVLMWIVNSMIAVFGLHPFFLPLAVTLLLVGLPIIVTTAILQRRGAAYPADGPSVPDPDPTPPEFDKKHRPPQDHESWSGIRSLFTWRYALGGGFLAVALWIVLAIGWILLFRQGGAGS